MKQQQWFFSFVLLVCLTVSTPLLAGEVSRQDLIDLKTRVAQLELQIKTLTAEKFTTVVIPAGEQMYNGTSCSNIAPATFIEDDFADLKWWIGMAPSGEEKNLIISVDIIGKKLVDIECGSESYTLVQMPKYYRAQVFAFKKADLVFIN